MVYCYLCRSESLASPSKMFLVESYHYLRTLRPTEPKFFNVLRFLSAIVFSLALVIYAWISLDELVSNIYKPTLFVSEIFNSDDYLVFNNIFDEVDRQRFFNSVKVNFTYPEITICQGNPDNITTLNTNVLNVTLSEIVKDIHNRRTSSSEKNLNNYASNGNSGCVRFTPISPRHAGVINEETDMIVTPHSSCLFNISFPDDLKITFQSVFIKTVDPIQPAYEIYNQYSVNRGQFVQYEFIIKERQYYSSYLSGMFGSKADKKAIIIEIKDKVIEISPSVTYTIIELKPKIGFIRYEEEKFQFTVVRLISNLGGFYGAISGIFALLFGAPKLSPWGVCQTSWLCCWPFRRSFKRHLASRYVSRAGIPLSEDPRKLPPGARLEDRVAVLEHLLKEYYIDAYYLEKLRTTRKKYLDIRNQLNDHDRETALELLGDENNIDLEQGEQSITLSHK